MHKKSIMRLRCGWFADPPMSCKLLFRSIGIFRIEEDKLLQVMIAVEFELRELDTQGSLRSTDHSPADFYDNAFIRPGEHDFHSAGTADSRKRLAC